MSLNAYLEEVAAAVAIDVAETESIRESLEDFKKKMNDYFDEHFEEGLRDIKLYGSFFRDTGLPRSIDDVANVDIMLIFSKDGSEPQAYYDRAVRAIQAVYPDSYIKLTGSKVVLRAEYINFEVSPAIHENGAYKVKKGDEWLQIAPFEDAVALLNADKANHYLVKPTIRLVKYWNVTKNAKAISPYQIEHNTVDYYKISRLHGHDIKQYFLTVLKAMQTLPPEFDFDRGPLNDAIGSLEKAIAEKDPEAALTELKKVVAYVE